MDFILFESWNQGVGHFETVTPQGPSSSVSVHACFCNITRIAGFDFMSYSIFTGPTVHLLLFQPILGANMVDQ